jgi:hypothetical protein
MHRVCLVLRSAAVGGWLLVAVGCTGSGSATAQCLLTCCDTSGVRAHAAQVLTVPRS